MTNKEDASFKAFTADTSSSNITWHVYAIKHLFNNNVAHVRREIYCSQNVIFPSIIKFVIQIQVDKNDSNKKSKKLATILQQYLHQEKQNFLIANH